MTLPVRGCLMSVRTDHVVRLRTYYRRLLGEPQREQADRWVWFAIPGGGLVIWHDAEAQPGAPGRVELTLTVDDLDRCRLDLSGWTHVSPIRNASHGRECFIHDPDGNRVVLYQPNTDT